VRIYEQLYSPPEVAYIGCVFVKTLDDILSLFDTTREFDGQTDRHTDRWRTLLFINGTILNVES